MLNYCIVKQRIGAITEDSPDDDNRYPDYTSVFGQIVFAPTMANGSAYKITDDHGVVHTVPATRITAQIVNGEIIHEGLPGLPLFAAGPNANPSTIVYTATYTNLTAAGQPITLNNITFRAVPGETIDLSSYTPVAGAPTPGIIQGPPGHTPYIGSNGNWWISSTDTGVVATSPLVHRYTELREAFEENTLRVKSLEAMNGVSPETPVDGQTANLISQPDSLTRSAVDKAVGVWQPGESLEAGQRVITPAGELAVATDTVAMGEKFDNSNLMGIAPTVYNVDAYETLADALKKTLYQESATVLYAVTQDTTSTVWKTTNGGQSWSERGPIGFSTHVMTKIAGTGTLIAVENTNRALPDQNPKVARSTDDGMTWSVVTTLEYPGLAAGMALSPAPGVVLLAEYGNVDNTVFSLRRSDDDGVTWTVVLSSLGADIASHDPGHLHSVVQDPITGKLITFMDLPRPKIYTSHDLGVTWELLGISTKEHHPNWVAPMFFQDHIAWGNDNNTDGRVYRLTRDDFYAGRWDNADIVAKLGNARFYDTMPILPGVWLMTGAAEYVNDTRRNTYNPRLYIVSQEGAVVAGALSASLPQPNLAGVRSASRVTLPGYPATQPDLNGHTWLNFPTQALPRALSMMPVSVGRDPIMPRIGTQPYYSLIMPVSTGIRFRTPTGATVGVLDHTPSGESRLSSSTSANRMSVFPSSEGFHFWVNSSLKMHVRPEGLILYGNPIYLNTISNGPAIMTGDSTPEGVVSAVKGSLYIQYGSQPTLWQRTTGGEGARTDGWEMLTKKVDAMVQGNFTAASASINTVGKYAGKQAFNTSTNRMLVAHGPAPTDPWGDGQGVAVHTPV